MLEGILSGLIVGLVIVLVGLYAVVKTAPWQVRNFAKAAKQEGVLPDVPAMLDKLEAKVDEKIDTVQERLLEGVGHVIEHEKAIILQMIVHDEKFRGHIKEFVAGVMPDFKGIVGDGIKDSLGSVAGSFKQIASVDQRMTNKMVKEAKEAAVKNMIDSKMPGASAMIPEEMMKLATDNPELLAGLISKFKGGGGGNTGGGSTGGFG